MRQKLVIRPSSVLTGYYREITVMSYAVNFGWILDPI